MCVYKKFLLQLVMKIRTSILECINNVADHSANGILQVDIETTKLYLGEKVSIGNGGREEKNRKEIKRESNNMQSD